MKNIKETFSAAFASKRFRNALAVIGAAFLLLITFAGGVRVGERRAFFDRRFEERYRQVFIGGSGNAMIYRRQGPGGYGVFGTVVSAQDNRLIVSGMRGGPEETALIGSTTIIRNGDGSAAAADIAPGSMVVIIGKPNDQGEIDARLVRIMPAGFSSDSLR